MATKIRDPSSLAAFYAEVVCARAGVDNAWLEAAFAAVPREQFLGPGPWPVPTARGDYIRTPSDDLAFIYADVVVGLIPGRGLNNGEPSSHARWLNAAGISPGERVAHVGIGVGYYTAIIAELTGHNGRVDAIEIDPDLARRAKRNLVGWSNVDVHCRSGLDDPFPKVDAIYVNAGVSGLADVWLEALSPGGRLVVPLTAGGWGTVMAFTARTGTAFDAEVISPCAFIECVGGQDETTARRLADAYGLRSDGHDRLRPPAPPPVRSLHRNTRPDGTCWFAAEGWWLSTRPLN